MIFNIKPLSAYQHIWFFKCIIWKMWKFLPQLFSFLHSETLRWPPNICLYLRVTPYFPDQNKHLLIDLFQTLHKVSLWVALYKKIRTITMQSAVAMEIAAILDFGGYILPSRPKSTFMDRFVSNFLQSKFVSCTMPKYTNGYHAICGCYGNGSHIEFWRGSRGTSSGCNFLLIALCCSQNMPNKHTCGMTKPIYHV